MGKDTLIDKIKQKFLNNWLFAVIVFLVIVYLGISEVIDATKKNRDNLFGENGLITSKEDTSYLDKDSEDTLSQNKKITNIGNITKHSERAESTEDKFIRISVRLETNSLEENYKILVNGSPAIISDNTYFYPTILLNKDNQMKTVVFTDGRDSCVLSGIFQEDIFGIIPDYCSK